MTTPYFVIRSNCNELDDIARTMRSEANEWRKLGFESCIKISDILHDRANMLMQMATANRAAVAELSDKIDLLENSLRDFS